MLPPLSLLLVSAALSQSTAPVLEEVRLEGAGHVDPAVFEAVISATPGLSVADWSSAADIRALMATGLLEDVVISLEGGVLTFALDLKPRVAAVSVEGAKKRREEDALEQVSIDPGDLLRADAMAASAQRIQATYAEDGFYLATVTPEVRPLEDGQVEVVFVIDEGQKVVVRQVDLVGVAAEHERPLRRFMTVRPGGPLRFITSSGVYTPEALDADVETIRAWYAEEGYIEAQVDAPSVSLSTDRRSLHVTIPVTPGRRYRVGGVRVDGDTFEDAGITERAIRRIIEEGEPAGAMQDRFQRSAGAAGWEDTRRRPFDFEARVRPLVTGQWFSMGAAREVTEQITLLYGDEGYAFAQTWPGLLPDDETGLVDVDFELRAGEQYRIDRIHITGNDPTLDRVIRREIPTTEGALYARSDLTAARFRLNRLGAFESVAITTPRVGSGLLDMNVAVIEQPTGEFNVGGGYSSAGITGTLSAQKQNFFGTGVQMAASVNASPTLLSSSAMIMEPYLLDTRFTLGFQGYYNRLSFFEREQQGGGTLTLGRYLNRTDTLRGELRYSFDQRGLTDIDPYRLAVLGGQLYRSGQASSAGLGLVLDLRNDRLHPTRGLYLSTQGTLTGGFRAQSGDVVSLLGGDFNFAEAKLNVRGYRPLGSEKLVLRLNSTAGLLHSTDGTVIPYIHRYRAGGINSVRGYLPFSLGPFVRGSGFQSEGSATFEGSGDPIAPDDMLLVGGTQTWVNNLEVEWSPMAQIPLSGVVFFDAGNAFGDPWGEGNLSLGGLRTSTGVGLRMRSPMGLLRLEYGIPINPLPDEPRSNVEFTVGISF